MTTTDSLESRLQRIFSYPLDTANATHVDQRVHGLSTGDQPGASIRSGSASPSKHRLLAISVASVPLTVIVVVAALVIGNLTAPPSKSILPLMVCQTSWLFQQTGLDCRIRRRCMCALRWITLTVRGMMPRKVVRRQTRCLNVRFRRPMTIPSHRRANTLCASSPSSHPTN